MREGGGRERERDRERTEISKIICRKIRFLIIILQVKSFK